MSSPLGVCPRPATLTVLALCLSLSVPSLLAGCDSNDPSDPDSQQTEFLVRYELSGACTGIRSAAYNVTGNGMSNGGSATFTLPWSFEQTVIAPVSPTATALSATCLGSGGVMQSLTGRILVDGQERASQSAQGPDQITVTVSTLLR